MQRKVSKEKFYYGGKSKTSQDLLHQHMSNHYRKILNAKKAVDNDSPQSYKAKRPATNNPGVVKPKVNRQLESPALTDRSISTNSNKGSCWGAESYVGSSRYHTRCFQESPTFGGPSKHNVVDMELVNRITYDTKKGPSSYCGEGWADGKSQHNDKDYKSALNTKQSKSQTTSSPTTKRRLPTPNSQESAQKRKLALQEKLKVSEVTMKGNKCFPTNKYKFYPRILKTNAVSKLRSLRVYHPPRRKQSRQEPDQSNPSNPRINSPLDVSPYKCSKIAVDDPSDTVLKKISFNPKEQSLTSSRDSAYNGGISSLPESRSPTPDERKKKGCCCCCCEKKTREGKFLKSSKPDSKVVENKVELSNPPQKVSRPPTPNEEEKLKKVKEDELYVKFIQDITTEVLQKNLYTNKALKNVMKKHIKNNMITLNQDRMLKEVEYLRTQLGIPEDKSLLQVEGNTEESENDCTKYYPVISDSEFVMPKNQTNNTNFTSKVTTRITGDSSLVSGDEKTPLGSSSKNKNNNNNNNRQVFSVIQVTKEVQEKKIPMAISPENSFDDSDQAFDSENLTLFKNLKKKIPRSDSSSSSDSEIFTRKTWEKTNGDISETEELLLRNLNSKKSRNVSFWKNPELNFTRSGRTVETKQKKMTTQDKDSSLQDKKEKTKND